MSLADQKAGDTQRQRHPDEKAADDNPLVKLRFLGSGHLLIKRWRLRHPNQKAETLKLRFLKLVSLADEKAGDNPALKV